VPTDVVAQAYHATKEGSEGWKRRNQKFEGSGNSSGNQGSNHSERGGHS
jgi:hypothetical protein